MLSVYLFTSRLLINSSPLSLGNVNFIHHCVRLLLQLGEDMFSNGVIPKEWEESIILNLYKRKGDALDRGNYRGLKLTEQVMKVLEGVLETRKWRT